VQHAGGMLLTPVHTLVATSIFFRLKRKKMQVESTIPHQKSPIFVRRLAIITSSLLPIHFSLNPTGDFWKVISNNE